MASLFSRPPGRPPKRAVHRTAVTLSTEDLAALGALLAAGRVLLGDRAPKAPVLSRFKAAMTRLGVPVPPGL